MDDPQPGSLLTILIFLSEQDIYLLLFNALIIILLFVGSALVSGSEVAYFSISQDDLEGDSTTEPRKIADILDLLQRPKHLLATILILNNFINIAMVMLASYTAVKIFSAYYSAASILGVLSVVMTFFIVFIGEIIPKVYANQNQLKFALRTVKLLNITTSLFRPLSWLLINVSNIIERRIRKKGYSVSVDELNQALEIASNQETTIEEKGILKGIVNFGTLSVKQIMKSRMDITALDIETNFHELLDEINKTGYSRIPVYNETIDKIEGILYIKDVLPHINEDASFDWQDLLRPGFFVPETKKIDTLFKDFQEKRIHIAIVVDEYGGTSGLITMEDVIEEIVGEINDEYDENSDVHFNQLDNNTFVFEGKTSLMDFCKITDVEHKVFDEVKGESESLGGLLLEINSTLPKSGAQINFEHFTFTIVAVNDKRIVKIRVHIKR